MDERLFSGTHPRSLNFAVIFLLPLATVWLTMFLLKCFGLRLDAVAGPAALAQGLAALTAAAALAARLRNALKITAVASAVIVLAPLFLTGFGPASEMAMHYRGKAMSIAFTFSWAAAIWLGAAWGGRTALVHPVADFPRTVGPGLKALLRKDPTAGLRLFVGVAIFLGGLALAPFLMAHSRKLVAFLLLTGGAVFASGLSVSEEDPPPDQN